jgi:hypothetical protein
MFYERSGVDSEIKSRQTSRQSPLSRISEAVTYRLFKASRFDLLKEVLLSDEVTTKVRNDIHAYIYTYL